jgi:hypothetical protein
VPEAAVRQFLVKGVDPLEALVPFDEDADVRSWFFHLPIWNIDNIDFIKKK